MGHDYSEEEEELIRKLWQEDGYSASQIARVIGHGVTRNSIIGKVHRKGWTSTSRTAGVRTKSASRVTSPAFVNNVVRLIPKNRGQVIAETQEAQLYGPQNDFPPPGCCKYIPGDPTSGNWQCCGYPTGDLSKHPQGDSEQSWCDAHLVVIQAPKGVQAGGIPHDPEAPYVATRNRIDKLGGTAVASIEAKQEFNEFMAS